jgi:threonine dehydrogenase-like Zn-dependent dehydrogenase
LSIIRCSYCIVDLNEERLAHARSFGCETINLTNGIPVQNKSMIVGIPEVDCFVDCVGFEAGTVWTQEKAGCFLKPWQLLELVGLSEFQVVRDGRSRSYG